MLLRTGIRISSHLGGRFAPARSYASGKDVRFGAECRALMLQGVDKLTDAVQVTLGPKGRNVVIERSYGSPLITKDGVTVAKNITFKDKYINLGAELVKSVASKTNDQAGDGTTTATVLARAIFTEGCKSVAAGMNPMDLKRGIDAAVNVIVDSLHAMSRTCSTKEEIAQVATISANNDTEIGELIASAMVKVGKEGVITVRDGKTLDNEIEIIEGMKFDNGFISPHFMTDLKTKKAILENTFVLLFDKKISSVSSLIPVLEQINRTGRGLLVIAENIEGDALTTLILNKLRGMKLCAVKSPGFGERRTEMMKDLATLTGGRLISEELGDKLEDVVVEDLGQANRIEISSSDTIIIDGSGSKTDIEARCDQIRAAIAETTSEYDREKLQERLAKLSGGIAVIKVGGASEVEVGEKKDRITDALNATRAAVEEGIVPGGGSALLYASRQLVQLRENTANIDQKQGIQIVANAIKIPAKTIANNAGVEGAVVVGKLEESADTSFGYNAQAAIYCNMFEAGIIDPTKVVRTALIDAASVASLMTTTEAMIVELPKDDPPSPPMGGGMGGMGGMDF